MIKAETVKAVHTLFKEKSAALFKAEAAVAHSEKSSLIRNK